MRRFFDRVRAFLGDDSDVTEDDCAIIISLANIGLIVGIAAIVDKVTDMFVNTEQQCNPV